MLDRVISQRIADRSRNVYRCSLVKLITYLYQNERHCLSQPFLADIQEGTSITDYIKHILGPPPDLSRPPLNIAEFALVCCVPPQVSQSYASRKSSFIPFSSVYSGIITRQLISVNCLQKCESRRFDPTHWRSSSYVLLSLLNVLQHVLKPSDHLLWQILRRC